MLVPEYGESGRKKKGDGNMKRDERCYYIDFSPIHPSAAKPTHAGFFFSKL